MSAKQESEPHSKPGAIWSAATPPAQRYRLVCDEDAHYYICPAERWSEAMLDFRAGKEAPDYCEPLTGRPTSITFTDPKPF